MKALLFLSALGVALVATAESFTGDITAAVRDASLTPTVSASHANGVTGAASILFDGNLSDYAHDSAGNNSQRYMVTRASLADPNHDFIVTYQFPDAFCAGQNVVVTGVSFAVGSGKTSGQSDPEVRSLWANAADRVPTSFDLEGSNDGSTWDRLVTYAPGELKNAYQTIQHTHSTTGDKYDDYVIGTASFRNWTSYRQYRVVMTGSVFLDDPNNANAYPYQICEIQLHGLYGDVVRPTPSRIDITAAARAASAGTASTSVGETSGLVASMAFDGVYDTGRWLSNSSLTTEALAGNGADLVYEITNTFARGCEIVATGYTLDVRKSWGEAYNRMPKSWKFQGYDVGTSSWVDLDVVEDFTEWLEMDTHTDLPNGPHIGATFSFANANACSCRKYRLLVSKLVGSSVTQLQFSEVQIWGLIDKGITAADLAAQVPFENPVTNLTVFARNNGTAPAFSESAYNDVPDTHIGAPGELFDGLMNNRYLRWIGDANVPFVLTYELPDTSLNGFDLVLTNYTIAIGSTTDAQGNPVGMFGGCQERMPKTWRLEGLYEDGRWVALDKRTNFTGWTAGYGTNQGGQQVMTSWGASFALPSNTLAAKKYRLRIYDVNQRYTYQSYKDMNQIQLSEITFGGKWGRSIGVPLAPPKGFFMIFR